MAQSQTRRPIWDRLRGSTPQSAPLARVGGSQAKTGGGSGASVAESPPPRRAPRLNAFWKALIITSFVMNLVLLTIVLLLGGFVLQWRGELLGTTTTAQGFVRSNLVELRDIVTQLEGATIRTTIPLNEPLPLQGRGVVVPVDQETTVTLTEPVPLLLEGADIDLGNGNRLRANNIRLTLPQGTPLRIALKMDIPLDSVTIPVVLDVPVEIPLKDTELGPQFERLGQLVDRLVTPFAPLLGFGQQPPAQP